MYAAHVVLGWRGNLISGSCQYVIINLISATLNEQVCC